MFCSEFIANDTSWVRYCGEAIEKTSSSEWVFPNSIHSIHSSVLSVWCASHKRSDNETKIAKRNHAYIYASKLPKPDYDDDTIQNKNIIVIIQQVRKKPLFVQFWAIKARRMVDWIENSRQAKCIDQTSSVLGVQLHENEWYRCILVGSDTRRATS